jgi:hypothetical protein
MKRMNETALFQWRTGLWNFNLPLVKLLEWGTWCLLVGLGYLLWRDFVVKVGSAAP